MELRDISAGRLDGIAKKIFFLAWLGERIRREHGGLFPVLVGGSAVQLYTGGNYASADMDIVLEDISAAVDVLGKNGFVKIGKQYYNAEYDLLVEFVSGPAPDKINRMECMGQPVYVTSLEEIIIDRLNAAKWWKVAKDLEWARVMLSSGGDFNLDIDYLRKRALEENISDYLEMIMYTTYKCPGRNDSER